ncbi:MULTISPECIES: GGDEF domain-containing protein [unclassified Butyrivibrio]|uniref:GGDEF domain-containing protein n=1 Tax=unclassified Butyrivibrio TaxID=2639466 RepID=UPI0003B51D63|nr:MULTISPECIES: GGDEF domain-containing protein [unclassified Butyrivibrio]
MNPACSTYDKYKIIAESVENPCAILAVTRDEDGTAKDVQIFAANDKFSMTGENVEGDSYTKYLPKEPEFENMCIKAAFEGEKFHNYVDTTKSLGVWTDNIILPLKQEEDGSVGYCQYIYELTKEMDAGKFSSLSPIIAGFVIKSCLELRTDHDFKTNLGQVIKDIREFTDASSACVISLNKEKKKAEIISQDHKEGILWAAQIYMKVPYDIAESWGEIVGESDCFIMRNKAEIERIEEIAPGWAKALKSENAESLCLVPLKQRLETVGYILLTNFNVDNANMIKDTLEILSVFLSSEMANSQFLKRLEWLTSVDMLTGVRNRAAMNRTVDEFAELLKWKKEPFGVAFCMMNGLQYLNEKNGHDAGNQALEKAGQILRETFDETEVFRSSGEEFSIVCENIDKTEFTEKIEKLRERCSDPDGVYFAIGYEYDDTEGDIRRSLRHANKQMLREKEAFYEKYPEKKY